MKATFPIDEKKLQSKGLKTVFGSVLTWAALMPTVGAWSVMDVAPWMYIPMGLVTVAGLGYYWTRQLRQMRPQWIKHQIRVSNAEQKRAIEQEITRLSQSSASWEAQALREALGYKVKIEHALLERAPEWAVWERIETLIDTLVFSMIGRLRERRKTEEGQLQKEIKEVVFQLRQTANELDDIIAPSKDATVLPEEDKLTRTLSELREEREIAQRVKQRLGTEVYETTTTSAPQGVSE